MSGSLSFARENSSAANLVISFWRNFPVSVFDSESTKYTPPRNFKLSANFAKIKEEEEEDVIKTI